MEEADLDVCLLAGRYTLLDGSAAQALLPKALARDVALVMGGVLNSGILAAAGPGRRTYDYVDAPPAIHAKAEALEAECRAFGVPLPAAALQFPLRHPATANVVVGARARRSCARPWPGSSSRSPTGCGGAWRTRGCRRALACDSCRSHMTIAAMVTMAA